MPIICTSIPPVSVMCPGSVCVHFVNIVWVKCIIISCILFAPPPVMCPGNVCVVSDNICPSHPYIKLSDKLPGASDALHSTNQRPVSRSRDHSRPIRGQYPGHYADKHKYYTSHSTAGEKKEGRLCRVYTVVNFKESWLSKLCLQVRNEQCVILKTKEARVVLTNSDEIGLKEWSISLRNALRNSHELLSSLAKKACKMYGTESGSGAASASHIHNSAN